MEEMRIRRRVLLVLVLFLGCTSDKKSQESDLEAKAPVPAAHSDAQNSQEETGLTDETSKGAGTPGVSATKIDSLATKVIDDGFKDMGLQEDLWLALFQLEQWHLMTFPDSKSVPPGLNIETHNGKRWVMAFTDTKRMRAYATTRKQLNADGTMMGLSVPSRTSFDYFEGLVGIEGVRFNEGNTGWFAPMANLRGIHAHLVKLGRL